MFRQPIRPLVACCLAAALVATYSAVGLAAPQQPQGDITVNGQVTVNGQPAVSGTTVFSDSNVTTAQNSSAVVSLGKLGRVEVLPGSSLRLSFTDNGVTVGLDQGRVRLSTPSGVNASVTTRDGSANGDTSRANTFVVDVECGNTVVTTDVGAVDLRSGAGSERVAAGDTDSIGRPTPGSRCAPGGGTGPTGGEGGGGAGSGAVVAVLVGLGGVIAAIALVLSRSEDDDVQPPGPADPSPIR